MTASMNFPLLGKLGLNRPEEKIPSSLIYLAPEY
jgi:hypothetical protein